jgi:hypothetical protein
MYQEIHSSLRIAYRIQNLIGDISVGTTELFQLGEAVSGSEQPKI